MIEQRQPRLMDASLHEVTRLSPSALTVSLNLRPLSVANMTLPEGEPTVRMRQFVEVYGQSGSLGVYRVSAIGTAYGAEQRITMEHGIATLEDDVTPADQEWTGTMATLLQNILDAQTVKRWELGTVEAEGSDYSLKVSRASCMQALLEAAGQAEDCYLDFDQSAYPWTLHLRKLADAVDSECRMSRNISGVTITFDDSSLCTRVLHDTLPGGYMDADTIDQWGVVVKDAGLLSPVDGQDAETVEENAKKARDFLEKHKNPAVSIDVEALQLATMTGDPLDAFTLAHVCRVALPDYGVTMKERIVSMHYQDLVSMPEMVRLTLSTKEQTAGSGMAGMRQDIRNTSRVVKEQHLHITETAEELKLHAKLIEAKAQKIDLEATDNKVSVIGQEVTTVGIRLDAAEKTLELKVDANGLISAINMQPGSIKIKSALIELDGATVVKVLEGSHISSYSITASEGDFDLIWGGHAQVDTIDCDSFVFGGEDITVKEKTVYGNQGVLPSYSVINYKDHDGTNKSMSVVTSVSMTGGAGSTIKYLG